MQLDKIIIALKQRTPWEAMDLGVILMRKLWPVIFFPWLILMSIVLAFVIFVGYQGYWYFSTIFMWLIKPVYESMILHILSRSVFGEYLTVSDVFSSKRQWLKTGLLTTLLFWRLSPSRSFNMPVHLLEGLTGEKRKKRLNSLHRVAGSHATGLTIIGIHFEYIVVITLYALLLFMVPDTSSDDIVTIVGNVEEQAIWFFLGVVIYAITLFLLEPFYVASGFMLYLNRRTQLEGWDIELDFKKLAQRINDPHGYLNQKRDNRQLIDREINNES